MKISVCVASYNGEKYIVEQISSILAQLSCFDELIISDDGSTDGTLSVIQSVRDHRIVLIKNEGVKGPTFNFENALKRATGDVIFLADQDDVWLDGKVSACINALNDFDLVVTNLMVVNGKLEVLRESMHSGLGLEARSILMDFLFFSSPGCCIAFKKDVLDLVLPFPRNTPMHDYWIVMVVRLFGRVGYISRPYILFRRHTTNVSTSLSSSNRSITERIRSRLTMGMLLFRRFFCVTLTAERRAAVNRLKGVLSRYLADLLKK